jgi:CMP-N,N'-diacetyllegionaminic acid synthase
MTTHILALIPARGGSKSIVDKNVRIVAGKPLLAWSIGHARAARLVTRTIVSTDSERYAALAREYGAETPFLRPAALAGDLSTDLETFEHALAWLREREGYEPELCVHLRPTYPLRREGLIDDVIETLLRDPTLDAVRTVTEVLHPPYKMWRRGADGVLAPLLALPGIAEPWNEPRQRLPVTYIQTANVDAVRTRVIVEQHSMTGRRIHGFVEPEFHDIDTERELIKVSRLLGAAPAIDPTPGAHKTFCFDIDGVIAHLTPNNDYSLATPNIEVIERVNRLYAAGHRIVLHTARGFVTGRDWRQETEAQLARWGLQYHALMFGKPAADYYIDDRMLPLEDLERL